MEIPAQFSNATEMAMAYLVLEDLEPSDDLTLELDPATIAAIAAAILQLVKMIKGCREDTNLATFCRGLERKPFRRQFWRNWLARQEAIDDVFEEQSRAAAASIIKVCGQEQGGKMANALMAAA